MPSIGLVHCEENGAIVPDTCPGCGEQECNREAYLIGTDPCPDLEGIWVQKVTLEDACDNCPQGQSLPEPSTMTFFEQVLNDPETINRWTQCDHGIRGNCGAGTRGKRKVTKVLRYFCLSDFPNAQNPQNPFDGAPTGNVPCPATFINCPCTTDQGLSSGTFPHRTYSGDPSWWGNYRATRTWGSEVQWNCCDSNPANWTTSCKCG